MRLECLDQSRRANEINPEFTGCIPDLVDPDRAAAARLRGKIAGLPPTQGFLHVPHPRGGPRHIKNQLAHVQQFVPHALGIAIENGFNALVLKLGLFRHQQRTPQVRLFQSPQGKSLLHPCDGKSTTAMLLTDIVSIIAVEKIMRRADRLLQLIQILRRHRRPVTGDVMARELEVSLRTVYRDIATLIVDGVPIRGEAGVGYILGEGYDLPPLMFTADELESVMLGLRWVARRGDADLARAALDTVAKIGTVLPEKLKPFLFDAALLVPPRSNFAPDKIDVAQLRAAIRDNRKVAISYRDEEGIETSRTIWPIAVSYFDAQRLIIAWCELRRGFRSFRTDRMLDMTVQKDKYPERRKVLLKRWQEEVRAETGQPQLDVFM